MSEEMDLMSVWNDLDKNSKSTSSKTKKKYLVLDSNSTKTIQFVKGNQEFETVHSFVTVYIEGLTGKFFLTYDPTDEKHPVSELVRKFSKLYNIAKNPSSTDFQKAQSFIKNFPQSSKIILGTRQKDEKGFVDKGWTHTEFLVANVIDVNDCADNIGCILTNGFKDKVGKDGKQYRQYDLGIQKFSFIKALKDKGIDIFKNPDDLYKYQYTIKINKPDFSDENWFKNNQMFEISDVRKATIDTSKFTLQNIKTACRYTTNKVIAEKLSAKLSVIDSEMGTNYFKTLLDLVTKEQEENSVSNSSNQKAESVTEDNKPTGFDLEGALGDNNTQTSAAQSPSPEVVTDNSSTDNYFDSLFS